MTRHPELKHAQGPSPGGVDKCGIIMPIGTIDGCSERHWSDVREILGEAIQEAGLEPNLVSDANEVGFINKRIVQNLYDNPIAICDVSAKNPNVMFELGMRLAFDKPTIIVKDDQTTYSFDIGGIEHLAYPRDLRFQKIREFRDTVAQKLKSTLIASRSDESYTTFLKHFGKFTIAKLDETEVTSDLLVLEELKSIRESISRLSRSSHGVVRTGPPIEGGTFILEFDNKSKAEAERLGEAIKTHPVVRQVSVISSGRSASIMVHTRVHSPELGEVLKHEFGADRVEQLSLRG